MAADDRWALVIKKEFQSGGNNDQSRNDEYEAALDMFDAVRSEKDYDWQSDIFIPEFPAHMLTQLGIDVEQWFKTRDFVETYLEGADDKALAKAKAAELCINRTLNRRTLNYFPKFCRAKLINNLCGRVYARGWWEKRYDDDDNVLADCFQFDILDPRQVRTSPEYTYSIQDKAWVIIWFEKTLGQLKDDAKAMGYFGLDDLGKPTASELSQEVTHKHNPPEEEVLDENRKFDVYERHGWAWAAEEGEKYTLGIDEDGDKKPNAEWRRTISTVASAGSTQKLIRFQLEPYKKNSSGEEYYPIIRGNCYIHPVDDSGVGNGRYARELQIAINDAYNLGADRSKLATIPVLKGKKYTMEDNSTVYIEPGHVIQVEDKDDLTELNITDNTAGQLNQIAFLSGKMSQVDSVYPSVMGQMPSASTTATAVAGTESRANTRTNLTAYTFEYTFATELYWMILQMTSQYAEPTTGIKLMGEAVYDFDPDPDYFYKPVTQGVESESSKAAKIGQLNQMLSSVAQLGDPRPVNMIIGEIMSLMGKERENLAGKLFPTDKPLAAQGTPTNQGGEPVSNQNGIPQSGAEQMARGGI